MGVQWLATTGCSPALYPDDVQFDCAWIPKQNDGLLYWILVLAVLLIIGGVEMNPGPRQSQTTEREGDQTRRQQIEQQIQKQRQQLALLEQELLQLSAGNTKRDSSSEKEEQEEATELNVDTNRTRIRCFHRCSSTGWQKYKKRDGTADMAGELFEVYVTTLLFIRGMFETSGFSIATNVDRAGMFDDIMFHFKGQQRDEEHIFFLQLKHRANRPIMRRALCEPNGDFSLLKYYFSYREIQKNFSSLVESVDFEKSFDNCKFVIYTNAMLESVDGCCEMPLDEQYRILSSGGQAVNFKADSDEYRAFTKLESYSKLLQEISESEYNPNQIKKFLENYKFFGQCKQLLGKLNDEKEFYKLLQEQLTLVGDQDSWNGFMSKLVVHFHEATVESALLHDIETYFGTSGAATQDLFFKIKDGVLEWWRKDNYFLTKNYTLFWDTIMECHVSNLVAPMCIKMEAVAGITFEHVKVLPCWGQVTHITTKSSTELGCFKILQYLSTVGHIMIDSNTLQSHLSEVLALWRRGSWCKVLVIEGAIHSMNASTGIAEVLRSDPGKKIIFITSDTVQEIRKLCLQFKGKTYTDIFKLNQLDLDSQNKILNSIVNFQGFPISLKSLTSYPVLEKELTAGIVVQLLTGEPKLDIGEKLIDQDDCYVSRTLLRNERVHKEILSPKGAERIVISGASIEELQQMMPEGEVIESFDSFLSSGDSSCQCFVINDSSDFNRVCELYDNVHWLRYTDVGLVWRQSKGDFVYIRNHLVQDSEYIEYKAVDEVMALPPQLVMVVAEPGMGKSTELGHLAAEIKQTDASTWVVKVDLNEHTDHLSQEKPSAMDLLMKAGKFDTDFQRSLFQHQVKSGGNVVVLFDGFDEISPDYSDKVINILKSLTATSIRKVWLTSRLVMRKKLEQDLPSLPFLFKPFTYFDQRNFLLKFWRDINTLSQDLSVFITELLKLTSKSLNDKLGAFTGIPLQTRMLAEAFQTEADEYCTSGRIVLPHKLDLLQLYKRFVDYKWKVYYVKIGIDLKSPALSNDYQNLRDMFRQNHMNCAVTSLLGSDEVVKLYGSDDIVLKVNKFVERFKRGEERTGIIVDVIKSRASFIHRTFTEFFVGTWFAKNFLLNKDFIRNNFFGPNFQIVRTFFDRILAEDLELHLAVLNQDEEKLENLLSVEKADVNTRDKGGRTLLHLAVLCHLESKSDDDQIVLRQITKTLLRHGVDPYTEDDILNCRPLRLADKIKAWSAVDLLLKPRDEKDLNKTQVLEDMAHTMTNTDNDTYMQDVLKTAAEQGLVRLVKFALDLGVDVGHPITVQYRNSECIATMLHEASRRGWLKLVELLVEHNADIEKLDRGYYDRTALMWAAERGQLHIVEYLTGKGANLSARDRGGGTALVISAGTQNYNVLKFLTQQGVDVRAANYLGNNALHCVSRFEDPTILSHLLDLGLNIDCRNHDLHTPLWRAAWWGRLELVQIYHKFGADINVRDINGATPLHIATTGGHLPVIRYLVEYGASRDVRDEWGRTPLKLAEDNNRTDVLRYFKSLAG